MFQLFKDLGFNITVGTGLKLFEFPDVTLNLNEGIVEPYR